MLWGTCLCYYKKKKLFISVRYTVRFQIGKIALIMLLTKLGDYVL
jgi:hypothetical protein